METPQTRATPEIPSIEERLTIRVVAESLPPLPLGWRVAIFVTGWVLILIGVAGLVLPGLQGIVTILLGAALLSLDNELVYRALRRTLSRWPRAWERVERFRARAHARLHKLRRSE
ncbi:MAG TPA: PGPGW domain-containing protein [Thermoanaerobaculia bacterium]|nr:PGPGW domain-containing protein [Thermoanaerobaculia bacterium]